MSLAMLIPLKIEKQGILNYNHYYESVKNELQTEFAYPHNIL